MCVYKRSINDSVAQNNLQPPCTVITLCMFIQCNHGQMFVDSWPYRPLWVRDDRVKCFTVVVQAVCSLDQLVGWSWRNLCENIAVARLHLYVVPSQQHPGYIGISWMQQVLKWNTSFHHLMFFFFKLFLAFIAFYVHLP